MIDFSHSNCQKQYLKQLDVGANVAAQISQGESAIKGVMIESFIKSGNQSLSQSESLEYGKSITDPCLSFAETLPLLEQLASAVQQRRKCK